MRPILFGILGVLAFATAPAAAQEVPFAQARYGPAPSALERDWLSRTARFGFGATPALDAALIVGGVSDPAELLRARRLYHAWIDPIVAEAAGSPTDIAAQLILRRLHLPNARSTPILREFANDASSILDILYTGRFNCLSATTLFVLAAGDAGLPVSAEEYRGHAAAALAVRRQIIHIEVTSAAGWNSSGFILYDRCDRDIGPGCGLDSVRVSFAASMSYPTLLAAVYRNGAINRSLDSRAVMVALLERETEVLRLFEDAGGAVQQPDNVAIAAFSP